MNLKYRYLLFGFEFHYPEGGFNDCKAGFNDIQTAIKEAERNFHEEIWQGIHVVDLVKCEKIYDSELGGRLND